MRWLNIRNCSKSKVDELTGHCVGLAIVSLKISSISVVLVYVLGKY